MTDSAETFAAFAQAALPAYGLHPEARLSLLNVSENGTFAIDDPDAGRSVLRVHRSGYHSVEAIRSELAWIDALRAEHVVSTPAYLPAADGSPVVTARLPDGTTRQVVRFAWVDGSEPHAARLASDFVQLGAISARLHAHARTWRRPPGFTRFVWDYDTSIGPAGHWGRWQDGLGVGAEELAVLGRLDAVLRQRLAAYGTGPERFGLVHADMRLANLLVAGDQVHVIDFDDCGFSWYLYDLASSVSFIEHEPYIPELIDAWVRGYRSLADLSPADEAELPTFVMLRRLLLVAWIGSHAATQTAQEMGPEFTTTSCHLAEQYLSDHI
ncbi:MAG: phosphotransferase [Kineosporiaceae bacterium]|nr:phosphotransferase [Kineosporiaceae bacterium]